MKKSIMKLNDLEQVRVEKLNALAGQGIPPYPTRSAVTLRIGDAIARFQAAEAAGTAEAEPVAATIAGRMRSLRVMGKLAFTHIEDNSGWIQLFLRVNELEDQLAFFKEYFDIGDFIEATGTVARTKTGEISLIATSIRMLSKAITPLPAAKEKVVDGVTVRHTALSDPEIRYRQRYADLIVNPDVKRIFKTRAKIVSALREFLDRHDFLEVETPILQPIRSRSRSEDHV